MFLFSEHRVTSFRDLTHGDEEESDEEGQRSVCVYELLSAEYFHTWFVASPVCKSCFDIKLKSKTRCLIVPVENEFLSKQFVIIQNHWQVGALF